MASGRLSSKRFPVLAGLTALFLLLLIGSASALDWGKSEIETEKLAVAFYNDVSSGGYKLVATEEFKKWVDAKEAMLVVDTMPFEASYKKNHVPGALQFEFPIEPLTQMDAEAKAKFEKLLGPDKNKKIVFYCGFTKCTRSHNGALWAKKLGYTNVYRYPGGIMAWMEAGYPVAKE